MIILSFFIYLGDISILDFYLLIKFVLLLGLFIVLFIGDLYLLSDYSVFTYANLFLIGVKLESCLMFN